MKTKVVLFLLFAIFCKNGFAQKLTIELFNKTGLDLDSVTLNKVYCGKIEKDSSLKVLKCKGFYSSSGWPLLKISGIIHKKIPVRSLTECGTKAKFITTGKHQFDIYLSKPEMGNVLTLKKHEWVIGADNFNFVFQILIGKIKPSQFPKISLCPYWAIFTFAACITKTSSKPLETHRWFSLTALPKTLRQPF